MLLLLKYSILAVMLTSLLSFFLDTEFIVERMKNDYMITAVKIANPEEPQYENSKQIPTSTEPTRSDFIIEQEQSDTQSQHYSELNGDDNDYIIIEDDEATIEIEPKETYYEQQKEEPTIGEKEKEKEKENEDQIESSESDHNDNKDINEEDQDNKEDHIIKSNDDVDVTDNQNETPPQMTIENVDEKSKASPETAITEDNKEKPSTQNIKTDEENKAPQNIDIKKEEKISKEIKETEKTEENVIIDDDDDYDSFGVNYGYFPSQDLKKDDKYKTSQGTNIKHSLSDVKKDKENPSSKDIKKDVKYKTSQNSNKVNKESSKSSNDIYSQRYKNQQTEKDNSNKLSKSKDNHKGSNHITKTREWTIMNLLMSIDPQKLYILGAFILVVVILYVIGTLIYKFFLESPWKTCPYYVEQKKSYTVDTKNKNAITKSEDGPLSTIIRNTPLPMGSISTWDIKILKSKEDDCYGIYVGVAPYDIDQNNEENLMCCGWYYDCFTSSLWSGPPHNYGWPKMKYGPVKENGKYLKEGSIITALLDPIKRELAFRLDGISYGAAYTELPLDKPLVPCVILGNKGDSVEFFVRKPEKVMKELPINPPENLVAKEVCLNSVTIAWSSVPNIKFYQVEIDWAERREISKKNVFKKEGLLPDTNYTFRVRAVCKRGFSDWSKPFNVKTAEPPDFSTCAWKELPRMFSLTRRYALNPDNPRIVTKVISSGWSFVIGTVQIPLGKVSQWGIKSLGDGSEFCVGVARYDADITISGPHEFGWYYYCYDSTLYSEAPHNYREKEYGPRRDEGTYVHKGDTVGVVMDTGNGNLSFIVGGANLGVAFEGIPLDKPLTPYVILYHEGDSLEFSPGRVEENVDYNNRVPPIYISNVTWNSFIVSWVVSDPLASYQVEINGYLLQTVTGDNILIDHLNPATIYNIRVRVVNRGSVSLWSDYMNVRTELAPFSSCAWKKCPTFVDIWKKYELDAQNPSIATCRNHNDWHTLISEVTIPLKMTSSWRIRIVHSKGDDGRSIYTGVAPYDIDQNGNSNITVSGWYLYCCNSSLYSGPPHNNKWKPYGPRLGEGNYVHTGSAVDVTMNMKRGCLSFSIDEVDYGVAFSAIPLDKPLVAATILYHEGDSVEMTFLRNVEE